MSPDRFKRYGYDRANQIEDLEFVKKGVLVMRPSTKSKIVRTARKRARTKLRRDLRREMAGECS